MEFRIWWNRHLLRDFNKFDVEFVGISRESLRLRVKKNLIGWKSFYEFLILFFHFKKSLTTFW